MHKLFITTMLIAGLAISACSGNQNKTGADSTETKTRVVTSDNFSIAVPKGWLEREDVMNGRKMLFLVAPKTGNYQPNMNVLKDFMKGRTMDEYIAFNLKNMEGMNYNDQKSGNISIGGHSGKYLTYNYDYQGRDIAVKSYIIPDNDVAYIITATCLDSQKGDFKDVFERTVETFTLK
jgi:hypothetical protein